MSIDQKIADLLSAHEKTPFQWGQFDCCQWALMASRYLNGVELPFPAYRGNERAAVRLFRRLGGYDGALAYLGATELASPSLASRGDVVLVDMPGMFGGAMAICTGAVAHGAGKSGLVPVPISKWIKAWRFQCQQ